MFPGPISRGRSYDGVYISGCVIRCPMRSPRGPVGGWTGSVRPRLGSCSADGRRSSTNGCSSRRRSSVNAWSSRRSARRPSRAAGRRSSLTAGETCCGDPLHSPRSGPSPGLGPGRSRRSISLAMTGRSELAALMLFGGAMSESLAARALSGGHMWLAASWPANLSWICSSLRSPFAGPRKSRAVGRPNRPSAATSCCASSDSGRRYSL